jgi:hypothetical protein
MTRTQKEAKRKKVRIIYEGFRYRNLEPKRKQRAEDEAAFISLLKKPLKIN